jgi:dTDP-4-dehydrorhamnose 3,5-epimerase
MMFKKIGEYLDGVVEIQPTQIFSDDRGFFSVSYRMDDFRELGLPTDFVQANHSRSAAGVVRGLHFQSWPPMAKLMRVTRGSATIVAVDMRRDSPTFLKHVATICTANNMIQQYAPAEFARGFASLQDDTEVQYLCTGFYDQRGDQGVAWNDPDIGIKWPVSNPELSERDKTAPRVSEWLKSRLGTCL